MAHSKSHANGIRTLCMAHTYRALESSVTPSMVLVAAARTRRLASYHHYPYQHQYCHPWCLGLALVVARRVTSQHQHWYSSRWQQPRRTRRLTSSTSKIDAAIRSSAASSAATPTLCAAKPPEDGRPVTSQGGVRGCHAPRIARHADNSHGCCTDRAVAARGSRTRPAAWECREYNSAVRSTPPAERQHSTGADVEGAGPVPKQVWHAVSPILVQMWQG